MAEKASFSSLRISHPANYQENHIITCSDQSITLMANKDKQEEYSREELDFYNARVYFGQLISEILTLFKIYCGSCGEHAKKIEPALARAIFFAIFGSIEASCRIIATSALLADTKSHEIEMLARLTEPEKLFLRQESEEISTRDWSPQQRTRFVSLQDALDGYPKIYARVFDVEFKLDKSCREWQDFIALKRLRDIGAHGNSNELRSSPDSMRILYKDIKRLLECRRWYCTQLINLPLVDEVIKREIEIIDCCLEMGFSEKCRKKRKQRYAQRKNEDGRN